MPNPYAAVTLGQRYRLVKATHPIAGYDHFVCFRRTRGMSSLLFGISPTDPVTYLVVSLLFLLVAAASFLPARQVTAIDPVIALRQE